MVPPLIWPSVVVTSSESAVTLIVPEVMGTAFC